MYAYLSTSPLSGWQLYPVLPSSTYLQADLSSKLILATRYPKRISLLSHFPASGPFLTLPPCSCAAALRRSFFPSDHCPFFSSIRFASTDGVLCSNVYKHCPRHGLGLSWLELYCLSPPTCRHHQAVSERTTTYARAAIAAVANLYMGH